MHGMTVKNIYKWFVVIIHKWHFKFIQGNVISSEYNIHEKVYNVPTQNLKTIEEYLHKAHRENLQSIYRVQ